MVEARQERAEPRVRIGPLGRGLAPILAVALVVRVGAVLLTRHLAIRDDSLDYRRLGLLLSAGHGFGRTVLAAGGGPTAFRAPLYPLFLGLVFRVAHGSLTAARVLQAGLGTLVVGLIGVVATQLFDRRHGLVAAAVSSVYPPLVLLGNGLLTEAVSLPLELGVIATALAYRRRRDGPPDAAHTASPLVLLLCGLLIGLAILTRPVDGVLVLPVLLLVISRSAGRSNLGRAAVVVGTVLLVLVPWEIRDASAFHRLLPVTTQDGYVLAGVYNGQAERDRVHPGVWRSPSFVPEMSGLFRDPKLNEATLDDALRRRAQTYARQHLGYVARVLEASFVNLFDLSGFGEARTAAASLGYGGRAAETWVLSSYAAGLLGIAGALSRRSRRVPLGVWLVPVLFLAGTIPTLGTLRYRAPIEPYFIVFASVTVVTLADRTRGHRSAA